MRRRGLKLKTKNKDKEILSLVDKSRLPEHVAIIMDGNGRWAQSRGLPRIAGHSEGMKSVKRVIKTANDLGIKALTLYAFSTENWSRPPKEIEALMALLCKYLRAEVKNLSKQNVQIRFMGKTHQLPELVQRELVKAIEETSKNSGLILNIALNYSGRADIVEGVSRLAADIKDGKIQVDEINETLFQGYLSTADLPEVDLLIRTSGEMRISNFLLWEIAYTELWITPIYWPEFNREHFYQALVDYQKRKRRFGGTVAL
ncbi:isoprenyl transferase [Candidatus Desantisbacteria bacterium]|nr:isoprenyl transferase [Candidatus Desantisbacteria bacterium]